MVKLQRKFDVEIHLKLVKGFNIKYMTPVSIEADEIIENGSFYNFNKDGEWVCSFPQRFVQKIVIKRVEEILFGEDYDES